MAGAAEKLSIPLVSWAMRWARAGSWNFGSGFARRSFNSSGEGGGPPRPPPAKLGRMSSSFALRSAASRVRVAGAFAASGRFQESVRAFRAVSTVVNFLRRSAARRDRSISSLIATRRLLRSESLNQVMRGSSSTTKVLVTLVFPSEISAVYWPGSTPGPCRALPPWPPPPPSSSARLACSIS